MHDHPSLFLELLERPVTTSPASATIDSDIEMADIDINLDSPEIFPLAKLAGCNCSIFRTRCASRYLKRFVRFISAQNQYDQASRSFHSLIQRQRWVALYASNAALRGNPASEAVVLVVALGSKPAEMMATRSSIIHGPRVFRLAKVRCGKA